VGARRARRARLLLALGAIAVTAVAVVALVGERSGGGAASERTLESMFQDDQLLLYQPPTPAGNATVQRTLATLRGLGVDRIRLTIVWRYLAPAPDSPVRPAFDAADPAAYPAAAWGPYDRIVRLARAAGIAVDFNVTAPGPLWAMQSAASATLATHFEPSAADFGAFVRALGRRYSGAYQGLPRVSYWTVWNEPNQPGWLAPQWQTVAGVPVPSSPRLYRALVDAAFAALGATGHTPRSDTILIGELAPEGSEQTAAEAPMPPMPFLRALYCVDDGYHRLSGAVAVAAGCPSAGAAEAFVRAHPGLFQATGFAHHPYSFFLAPALPLPDPNYVPLANLARLEHGLDSVFRTYGVGRSLPLYLTEYGYETNPPNPIRGVSLRNQSLFLNEAQYMAWSDPRVRVLSQFLLQDSAPDRAYPPGTIKYWSTFQTGLQFLGGKPKLSFNSYRLPIFLPTTTVHSGVPLLVWGMLRPASATGTQKSLIEWRPSGGAYRTIQTVSTINPSGIVQARVTFPGPGAVRLSWTSSDGQTFYSRAVGLTGG
jgi:hypothetical protein